jgi:hypothetical protein
MRVDERAPSDRTGESANQKGRFASALRLPQHEAGNLGARRSATIRGSRIISRVSTAKRRAVSITRGWLGELLRRA